MYDIDRFFNEKISLNFDTNEEAKIFSEECAAKGIINSGLMLEHDATTNSFVCNWNSLANGKKDLSMNRILYGTDEFHISHGWKSMKASELIVCDIVTSKAALMEFLGGE